MFVTCDAHRRVVTAPATFGSAGTDPGYVFGNTVVFDVPPDTAAGDIIICTWFTWTDFVTVTTPATGFTAAPDAPISSDGGSGDQWRQEVYWKRATGSDTGTYTFTLAASCNHSARSAIRVTGCPDTGSPFNATDNAVQTSGTTIPPVQLTTTVDGCLLVYIGGAYEDSITRGPTGFTDDAAGTQCVISHKSAPTAGDTGALVGAWTSGTGYPRLVWLGALAGGGTVAETSYTGPSPSYFSTWSNGPPTSDSWIPLGTWNTDVRATDLISPYTSFAQAAAAAHVNVLMGTWNWLEEPDPSPTNWLNLAEANGLKVIANCIPGNTTDATATANTAYLTAHPEHNDVIIAWLPGDEADMMRSNYHDNYSAYTWQQKYLSLHTQDPTRPVHGQWGKTISTNATTFGPGMGSAWDTGTLAGDMTLWMQSCDTTSCDTYWWTDDSERGVDPHRCYAYRYGWNIDNMRKVTTNRHMPMWGFVELTRQQNTNLVGPTPDQMEQAIWQQFIHGARGMMYFPVDFHASPAEFYGPWSNTYYDHTLGNAILARLTSVNARLLGLAPVINSPELGFINNAGREVPDAYITVSTTGGIPVDMMVREYAGKAYVFAQASGDATTTYASGSTTATFTWHVASTGTITVRDESRSLAMSSGVWTDTFTAYQTHIYVLP